MCSLYNQIQNRDLNSTTLIKSKKKSKSQILSILYNMIYFFSEQ